MRSISIITLLLFVGLTACNNASTNNESTSDSMEATSDHDMSAASSGATMPAAPADARVYFVNLKDGQTVTSPFKVEMGASGISVDPAGTVKEGSGHHHILIDAGDSMARGTTIPSDSTHLHFGKAQTETELTLAPGKHTLTLQFADGAHRSYGSQLASSITVTVKE